ncbi:hypothetical protein HPB49_001852 [Dermacentor silvarum]|uniref:Uncharacterized protein n=1 Tax=Dermacentor silvarum TaxID=543639 RepID=A0ACB8CUJ4_DERSI|nr:hypothetical protein HPB49_001852 [Dermacentor silvarum]
MHPKHHFQRRHAQPQALQRRYGDHPLHSAWMQPRYVPHRSVHTVSIVVSNMQEVTSASFRNTTTAASEEAVIALAIAARPNQDSVIVLSDTQETCRSYFRGQLSPSAYPRHRDHMCVYRRDD